MREYPCWHKNTHGTLKCPMLHEGPTVHDHLICALAVIAPTLITLAVIGALLILGRV